MTTSRVFSVVAASAAFASAPALIWAQERPDPYWYDQHPHMWGGGWGGMVFGPLLMILVLTATIAVVVLLVRWIAGPWQAGQPPYQPPPDRTPLDILKARYARGEIDKAEFEERRRVIGD